jgi:CHAT domain-containing protein/tetratricopeptide (TPR) repeat protein
MQRLAAAESTLATAEILARARLHQDLIDATSSFNLISYTWLAQDHYESAHRYSSLALQLRESRLGPDDPNTASSRYTHALVLKWLGHYSEALRELDKSIRDLTAAYGPGDPRLIPPVMTRGFVLSELGRHSECEEILTGLLERLRKAGLGRSHDAAQCLLLTGVARSRKGEFAAAMEALRMGLLITRSLSGDEHVSLSGFYSSIAELLSQIGDHEGARDYAGMALRLVEPMKDRHPGAISTTLRVLSSVYLRIGEPHTAHALAIRDLAIKRELFDPRHPDMVVSLENAGDACAGIGNMDGAVRYYHEAIEILSPRVEPAARSTSALLAGKKVELLREKGRLAEADSLLAQATTTAAFAGQTLPVLDAFLLRLRGDLSRDKGNPQAALSLYDMAISTLCKTSAPCDAPHEEPALPAPEKALQPRDYLTLLLRRARTLHQLALVGNMTENLRAAASSFSRACDVIDDIRRTYTREASRVLLAGEMARVYDEGAEAAMELASLTGNPQFLEEALMFAERGKARSLLDRMVEARARHESEIPASFRARQDSLRNELMLCDMELARSRSHNGVGTDSSPLARRRFALRRELEDLADSLRSASPEYSRRSTESSATPPAEIRRILDEQSRIVEYQLGRAGLRVFVIGPEGTTATTVRLPADFAARVNSFTKSIRTLDRRQFTGEGSFLYRLLLDPVAPQIHGARRLVIVPDDVLFTVPFEALLTPSSAGDGSYRDLPYLLRTYEVRYAYSASSFRELRTRGETGAETAFAGFAPVFADSTGVERIPPAFAEERSVTLDGKTYRALRHSADEIRTLAQTFSRHGQRSRTFLNKNASEGLFKETAGSYRVIHVATHGFIDDKQPALSAILFTPEHGNGATDDGVLYAGECYDLKLDANLVVLSSCESGAGRLVKGEGVLALTRGFLCSGARNVMVSLWKVFDAETQQLMVRFYDRMLEGNSYAAALRAAKLSMIADPRSAAPAKWAGFIITGR